MQTLITTKANYDKLSREARMKERETSELNKRFNIVNSMDFKEKQKSFRNHSCRNSLGKSIDGREGNLLAEKQNNDVLINMNNTLKEDLRRIKEKIAELRLEKQFLNKEVETQKLLSNKIKNKFNNMHLEIKDLRDSTLTDEKKLMNDIEYYEAVIKQKQFFMNLRYFINQRQTGNAQERDS